MTVLHTAPISIIGIKVAEVDAVGGFVLDAEDVAPLLELAPETFMDKVRKGILQLIFERGTEKDLDKIKVTFRHRTRLSVLTLDAHGRVLNVA